MKYQKTFLAALMAGSLLVSHQVQAGPPVHITVKNLGTQDIVYQLSSSSAMTEAHANPKPKRTIGAMNSDSFTVMNTAFPDITTASLNYTAGNKSCEFRTSYIKTLLPGSLFSKTPNTAPKWDKKATGSGGATCTVTVTSTRFSDHSWSVVFTMK